MKKIAVINDLSGFGRCSLTAAIPVLAAMGIQACPLPTAILTAQTGYPSYYCDDYTDKMEYFRTEWQKMGQHFDGIYTGFVANEAQIQQIFQFINIFRETDTFLLVDPIMGDDGITYDMYTPSLLHQMQILARRADIITPNLTELCLLTGKDFSAINTMITHSIPEEFLPLLRRIGREFLQSGDITSSGVNHMYQDSDNKEQLNPVFRSMIVTGIRHLSANGTKQVGNLYLTLEESSFFPFPYIGGSYSGTGDLFASCIAGGIARGDSIPDTIQRAGEFLAISLEDSVKEKVPRNDGVNFERYLSRLMPAEASSTQVSFRKL